MDVVRMLLKDESGNTAAEYGLLLALIGAAVAIAAVNLGNTIATAMNRTSNTIAKCTFSC